MDKRSTDIMIYALNNPSTKSTDIANTFAISLKQFNYSFKKINQFLLSRKLDPITRTKRGALIIPNQLFEHFSDVIKPSNIEYIFTEQERCIILLLHILTRDTELSLLHLSDITKVSKNTTLNDIKEAKKYISERKLIIKYNRDTGYHLEGSEVEKRLLIISLVHDVLEKFNHENVLIDVCNLTKTELIRTHERNIHVEKMLDVRITDARLQQLKYIVILSLKRIEMGKLLHSLPDDYYYVSGTKEYETVKYLLSDVKDCSEEEYLFMTVQFLISNSNILSEYPSNKSDDIFEMVKIIVDEFEQLSCITFKMKDKLYQFLFQHFKPAFFRIKYGFHVYNELSEAISNDFRNIHNIVKKSVNPVEKIINKKFPESELAYITIIFGSWLQREESETKSNLVKRAIVLCENGVSISNYLFIVLKSMFNNIIFVDCLSIRDLKNYNKEYDIIFTSKMIHSDKPVYLVNPMMNEAEKTQLYMKVTYDFLEIKKSNSIISEIMNVIEKNINTSEDSKVIRKELEDILMRNNFENTQEYSIDVENSDTKKLSDLLSKDKIMLIDKVMEHDWKKLLWMLADPLLRERKIEKRYVEEIIRQVRELHPPIMIGDGLVMMHAGIDDGVNELGMAFLRLPEKISIEGYIESDMFLMIATPDRECHLTALNQVIDCVIRKKKINELRGANSEEELLNIFIGNTSN